MQNPSTTAGVLHPGEMGVSVAASLRAGGAHVLWVSEERGERTRARAEQAGLEDALWLNGLVNRSEFVFSVCPPDAAVEVAQAVADLGYRGVYVDANAISPQTAQRVREIVERPGAAFVDGGIIGPPALRPGTTRLYLAGEGARKVGRHFEHGAMEAQVLDGPVGSASALKMCYAAVTKGTTALLAASIAVAEHEGVRAALFEEWRRGEQDLAAARTAQVRGAARRAWRWAGEMDEIAAAFAAAGLPAGFHEAAAELFRRLDGYRDAPEPPSLEELVAALTGDSERH